MLSDYLFAVWWTVWLCTNILSLSRCLAVRWFVRCCMNILFSNHFLAVPWIVCDYVRLFCLLTNSFPVRCNVWLCMVMFVYKPLCCDELCDCVGTFCFLTIFLLYGELCDCMVIHFTNQFLALQWVVWQCTIILFPNHFFCCTVNCVTVRLLCLLKKIQKKSALR